MRPFFHHTIRRIAAGSEKATVLLRSARRKKTHPAA
jgi:hypothetical protein